MVLNISLIPLIPSGAKPDLLTLTIYHVRIPQTLDFADEREERYEWYRPSAIRLCPVVVIRLSQICQLP
jgi:hypothetical protein